MTWESYTAEVRTHLLQYNRMQGVQSLIDLLIRTATADLQRALPWFQTGNETLFVFGQLTQVGYAQRGVLPQGADFRFSVSNADGDEADLAEVSWDSFDTYVSGDEFSEDRVFAVKAQSHQFMICPGLEDGETLKLRFDGVKYDYTNPDTVPFTSLYAEAVSHAVLAELSRRVDNDQNGYQSFMRSYGRLKAKLVADGNGAMRSK